MYRPRFEGPRAWAGLATASVVSAALGCGGGNPITDPFTDPINDALDDAFDDALEQFEDEFLGNDDPGEADLTPASLAGRTLRLDDDDGGRTSLVLSGDGSLTRQTEPRGDEAGTTDTAAYLYGELSNTAASLGYTVASGEAAGLVAAVSLVFDTGNSGRFLSTLTPQNGSESTAMGRFTLE